MIHSEKRKEKTGRLWGLAPVPGGPAAAASSKPGTLLPVLHPNAAEREGKKQIYPTVNYLFKTYGKKV